MFSYILCIMLCNCLLIVEIDLSDKVRDSWTIIIMKNVVYWKLKSLIILIVEIIIKKLGVLQLIS